ncbi:MAG TPA: hypothetical protein PKE37_16160 [Thiomonas arsenitoxydans]|uniref:hypothetical protein n=1 Tax=Thiomonas arsenitoxydans (strain DSM 22701 / CIP 110005 / 3As) TaxID=426114 RepID=UPI002C86AABE|nr:hypothetical protein [Thiomonas arsenitoxydans]HML83289.1 hypothetical protein [Thiomonas arsenitoxydans]
MALEQIGRQPHGSTTDEDTVSTKSLFDWPEPGIAYPLDDRVKIWRERALLAAEHAGIAHEAVESVTTALGYNAGEIATDQLACHVRNTKALADKLQTLLDSKTHQVEALQKEVAIVSARLNAANTSADCWWKRAEVAKAARAEIAGVLIMHADGDFLVGDPTTLELAKHIVDKLITAPEPDIDTVPLADLLEAVGTYLEHDQAVTIRGSFEAVRHVQIHAMGLTFAVETHEASEALTKAQELAQSLVVEAAR